MTSRDAEEPLALERLLRLAAAVPAEPSVFFPEITRVIGEIVGDEPVSDALRRRLGAFIFVSSTAAAYGAAHFVDSGECADFPEALQRFEQLIDHRKVA